jgi:hypothetical protein
VREITGLEDETLEFDIEFPDGFFPDELSGIELIEPGLPDFQYTLNQLPFSIDDTKITYRLTVNEPLDNDLETYLATFMLNEIPDYHLAGNEKFTIIKPENIPRDVSLNTAAHFYDLEDGFYRTYGELWFDFNKNDTCDWGSFNQFTFPVEVPADHPNAVLYSDQGTIDPDDDIYHHAFRIGFNSPNVGRTTNSFNLKRWFDNDYTDADESPGFNIPQALEFYPDNGGTSATSGTVKVIAQDLITSGKNGDGSLNTYTISIEGDGEYIEISSGIFEISLELRATNNELFGGTRTATYKIFNTPDYEEPIELSDDCFQPMEL